MRHVKFPILVLAVLPLLMVTMSAANVNFKRRCLNPPGTYLHTKPVNKDYNCYQYTRAALIKGYVNMASGVPSSSEEDFFGTYTETTIIEDQDFIRVCSLSQAKAVAFLEAGHSVIKLNDGRFAFTFDNYPDVETSFFPDAGSLACDGDEQYYDAIPNIAISGGTQVNQGQNITLTLTNGGQALPSYLQLSSLNWSFNSSQFQEISKTSTSVTLKAKDVTGNFNVIYNLFTGCNANANFRTKSVQVLPNCTGTLNQGPLYTFNTVSGGTNQVEMYLSSWTWVKTSGNASWSTSNGGKNMSFSISSGCSTFNAYNASCNLTFTFCKYSSLIGGDNNMFVVFDLINSKVVKEGQLENEEDNESILDGLPQGHYVVYLNGTSTQYVKSN